MENNKPKKPFISSALFIVPAAIVATLLIIISGILVNMYSGIRASEKQQKERMSVLREHYLSPDFRPVSEKDFCEFNLSEALEKGVRYNEVQYIATHNSYKEDLTTFSRIAFNIIGPVGGMKERQFEYSMPTLTEQLNSGIRFFELDLSYMKRSGRWEIICVHNPILDNKSNAIDIKLAFEEIKLWSENNPGHLPLTIFIEPKRDYLFLPTLKELGPSGIKETEEIIKEVFGPKLITPSRMLGSYNNFREMTEAGDWPHLKDMLNSVLFVLFPNYSNEYFERDPAMTENVFFISQWYHSFDEASENFNNNTLFIMTNEPDTLYNDNYAIEVFLAKNYFVRTRLDFFPVIDPARKQLSFDSGAQLLTTDYPKGNTNAENYYASFEDGHMMRLSPREAFP